MVSAVMNKVVLYPLRRLHGMLYEWKTKQKKRNKFLRYLKMPKGNKFFILGTPLHTNIGDSAIVIAQILFLAKIGFESKQIKEITVSEHCRYSREVECEIQKMKFLCWLGGGNMGDVWPYEEQFRQNALKKNPNIPVIIFPQTIDYRDQSENNALLKESLEVYNSRKELSLIARETESFDLMRRMYPNAKILLTPDIVLFATAVDFCVEPQDREGILLYMRTDIERSLSDEDRNAIEKIVNQKNLPYVYTDMYSNCPVTKENRAECVRAKMQEFAGAKLVITDRLHGMVFAAITGTPCIAFSNNNHKVKGTYEWIRYLPYIRYAESVEDVEKYLPELLAMENCEYDKAPLMPYFDKIAEVVKKYAAN